MIKRVLFALLLILGFVNQSSAKTLQILKTCQAEQANQYVHVHKDDSGSDWVIDLVPHQKDATQFVLTLDLDASKSSSTKYVLAFPESDPMLCLTCDAEHNLSLAPLSQSSCRWINRSSTSYSTIEFNGVQLAVRGDDSVYVFACFLEKFVRV